MRTVLIYPTHLFDFKWKKVKLQIWMQDLVNILKTKTFLIYFFSGKDRKCLQMLEKMRHTCRCFKYHCLTHVLSGTLFFVWDVWGHGKQKWCVEPDIRVRNYITSWLSTFQLQDHSTSWAEITTFGAFPTAWPKKESCHLDLTNQVRACCWIITARVIIFQLEQVI